jgi:tetratricopeptide (TPR) repeat protein
MQADVDLEVVSLKCDTATRQTEASVRDVDGNRVKRQLFSVDAVCVARIDALSRGKKRLSSFYAKGEGTTPNVERVTPEENDDALRRAIRHAAVFGADRITPRRVRESIELDERAPAYSEALSMIEIDRLVQARTIFERELQRHPRSAPLRFNLGALYEALGDRVSAEKHYTAARVLAPEEPRYATELKRFSRQQ